jgi:hypothetical protein
LVFEDQDQKIAAFGSSYRPGSQFRNDIALSENDLHLYRKRYSGTISLHTPMISAAQRFDPVQLFSSFYAVAISLQRRLTEKHQSNTSD